MPSAGFTNILLGSPVLGWPRSRNLVLLAPILRHSCSQSEGSTGSRDPPPPTTAHLVLGEGGRELQPPGRYPGRAGRLLPGEPSASVATELGQAAPRHHENDQVKHKPQPCKQMLNKDNLERYLCSINSLIYSSGIVNC